MTGDIHFDPYDHELVVYPYPLYRRMREEMPLYYNPELDFYAVSRFDDVSRTLLDHATPSKSVPKPRSDLMCVHFGRNATIGRVQRHDI